MAGTGKQRQYELFLSALLTSPTIAQAAQCVGISDATAARWMKDPAFQARYAEAKQQAFREAIDYLKQTMLIAVMVLRQTMLARDVKDSVKVASASKILELGFRAHEQYELEQRITALEATLGGKR